MRVCPTCGEAGLREHSVLVDLDALAASAAEGGALPTHARCARCRALFRHPAPDALLPVAADALGPRTVWIVPPWKTPGEGADLEMSWDLMQDYFEDAAVREEAVRPLAGLVVALRAEGYDTRLRAGQSLLSLGLSRSRAHGLRPEQSHLFLSPHPDGRLAVRGLLGGEPVRLEPVDAVLDGRLRALVDALAALPMD